MNLNDDVVYRCLRLGPLHQRHPGRSGSLVRHHDRLHHPPPCPIVVTVCLNISRRSSTCVRSQRPLTIPRPDARPYLRYPTGWSMLPASLEAGGRAVGPASASTSLQPPAAALDAEPDTEDIRRPAFKLLLQEGRT